MSSVDDTLEIIPIGILERILFDDVVFDDFINCRNEFNEDITKYINPLNDYMDLYSRRAIGLSENVFNRINEINSKFGGNRRFEYMSYLLNTEPLISTYDIKQILTDEETFLNFLDFNNHRNWFPLDLLNYLLALDDYVGYFKKTNISLGRAEEGRFNRIKLEYALHYKRMFLLKGSEPTVSIAPELEEEILSSVDLNQDKFTIARELYVELNKRCTYSVEFMSYDQMLDIKKAKEIYDGDVRENNGRYEVVCSTWSLIYAHLLNSVGIAAKVCTNKGIHTFVDFNCDGTYMRADGTQDLQGEEGLYLNDLVRCQLGLKTAGFTCMEPDKDVSYVLDKADEEIEYKHNTKISIIRSYEQEYKNKYMSNNKTSINDRAKFLMDVANSLSLENIELFRYINILYDSIFDKEEFKDVGKKYVSINRKHAGFVLSYKNDKDEYEFIVFAKNYNKKYNARRLNRLIDRGKVVPLGHNKEILGLEREQGNESNRKFAR